jgi:hypothetical protein
MRSLTNAILFTLFDYASYFPKTGNHFSEVMLRISPPHPDRASSWRYVDRLVWRSVWLPGNYTFTGPSSKR